MAQKYRSPFAQAMSYYSGHIRQQTQMAFQEAARQMQSEQASELAQRQYLMDRLKLEYSLLNGLRKQKTQLKKQISKTGVSKSNASEAHRLSQLVISANSNYLNAMGELDDDKTAKMSTLRKTYFLQPDIKNKINQYVNDTYQYGPADDMSTYDLQLNLGLTPGETKHNNALSELKKAFNSIGTDDNAAIQKEIAMDYLIHEKYKSLGFRNIDDSLDDDARNKILNELSANDDAFPSSSKSTSNAKSEYDAKIASESLDPGVAEALSQLQTVAENAQINLDNWSLKNNVTPKQMDEIKDTIGKTTESVDSAQKRITELTSQLDKPKVSTGPQTLSERAGNILFKNELQKIANDRMKQALKNMPDEEKQFYKYYKRAEELSNKGIPEHSDGDNSRFRKSIDKWLEQEENLKKPNLLKEYLDYEKSLKIPEQLKDEMTIRGIARIFDTVKGAVQENEEQEQRLNKTFEVKDKPKIGEVPAPLDKNATLGDASDNIETGHRFERTFTRTRDDVVTSKKYYYEFTGLDEDGNPKFKYIDPNGRRKNPTPAQLEEAIQLYNTAR